MAGSRASCIGGWAGSVLEPRGVGSQMDERWGWEEGGRDERWGVRRGREGWVGGGEVACRWKLC